MNIQIKRVYDEADENDGVRLLVDRLWPRGISKEKARIDHWYKLLSPSNELRKWYRHDESNWEEFKQRYFDELVQYEDEIEELIQLCKENKVTFLYSSRELTLNNAFALKEYIEKIEAGKKPA